MLMLNDEEHKLLKEVLRVLGGLHKFEIEYTSEGEKEGEWAMGGTQHTDFDPKEDREYIELFDKIFPDKEERCT